MTVCKRIGAWLLTLVLLVSALPYTAFAASEDSHVVNATMEETSVEDIANNVTTAAAGRKDQRRDPEHGG